MGKSGKSVKTESDEFSSDKDALNLGLGSTISVLGKLVFSAVLKFWGLCTSTLLILLLTYWFYGGLVSFILLMFAVLGFLYNAQDMLLYYPDQPAGSRLYVDTPSIFGLPYDNFYIKTCDGVKLHLILIKQPQAKFTSAPTVIFFHGNAGNIGHRLLNSFALYNHTGANILLVEYRGYGRSEGKISEQGLYIDSQAAMNYICQRSDINQEKLIVFGRSLGGAVAVQLASIPYYASRISCLITENTFTSLPDIGRQLFNLKIVKYLPEWCHKNKFPSSKRISKIKVPTLFLSGLADDLIPPRMMQLLFDDSGSMLKRMAKFPDGTHNETWQCNGYYESINRFLQEVEEMKTSDTSPNSAATYTVDIPFDDLGGGGVFAL